MNYYTFEHLQAATSMTKADIPPEFLGPTEIGCAEGTKAGSKQKQHYLFPQQCLRMINVPTF